MIERYTQTLKQQNKIISINDIITKVLLRQWRYGIMSTVPYKQQKIYRQINNLIITREAGLTNAT